MSPDRQHDRGEHRNPDDHAGRPEILDSIDVTVSNVGVRTVTNQRLTAESNLVPPAGDKTWIRSSPSPTMTPEKDDERHDPNRHSGDDRRVRRSQEPICAAQVPSLGVNTGSTPCDVWLTWTRLSSVIR